MFQKTPSEKKQNIDITINDGFWLVVSTHLKKYARQIGSSPQGSEQT